MPAKRFSYGILLVLLLGIASLQAGGSERPDFAKTRISLDRGDGKILTYRVELATTPHQHAYGLMHVTELAKDAGMLFVFKGMAVRSFWMKNTLIPLDMLFFDADGELVSSVRRAVPDSLIARRSDGPAQYVLELPGGSMDAAGIGAEARLQLPANK